MKQARQITATCAYGGNTDRIHPDTSHSILSQLVTVKEIR